jgi:hypothetical protein
MEEARYLKSRAQPPVGGTSALLAEAANRAGIGADLTRVDRNRSQDRERGVGRLAFGRRPPEIGARA